MPVNKKMIIRGAGIEEKSWEVDLDGIGQAIHWAHEDQELLEREVLEMEEHFPNFIATIAAGTNNIPCPRCGEILVWDDGIRCVSCRKAYIPRGASRLCFIGQIPTIIGEVDSRRRFVQGKCRPFFKRIFNQIEEFPRYFFSIGPDAEGFTSYYFAPVVYGVYPDNWNKDVPVIILENEYFQILGIRTEHVFPDTYARGYRLCNYANWPRVTMRVTLQQRIVPRIIIDLMISDLTEIRRLDQVLRTIGTDKHGIYNVIGRGGRRGQEFARLYNQYVTL